LLKVLIHLYFALRHTQKKL